MATEDHIIKTQFLVPATDVQAGTSGVLKLTVSAFTSVSEMTGLKDQAVQAANDAQASADAAATSETNLQTEVAYVQSIRTDVTNTVALAAAASATVAITELADFTRAISLYYASLTIAEGTGLDVDFRIEVAADNTVLYEYLNIDGSHVEKTPVYMDAPSQMQVVVTNKAASAINFTYNLTFMAL